jgi:Tfp pilus assembly protein PilO
MQSVRQNMAKGRVTLRMMIVFAILVAGAIFVEQYRSYLQQRDALEYNNALNRQRLDRIVNTLSRQDEFTKQLSTVEQRYTALRQQLPAEPQLEEFQRGVEKLLKEKGLGVQAKRVARYSRPFYQEIRLAYSIKGGVNAVQEVLAQLHKQPRLVLSTGAEKESFEFTGLVLSIFSIPPKGPERILEPTCLTPPQDVWLPLLKGKLASLYENYAKTCRAVMDSRALYRDIQRYRFLNEEVLFLEHVLTTITASR